MRTPRRTILTALGVGAAVTALVGVLGLLDSFGRSIDDIGAELAKDDPDRLLVQFDTSTQSVARIGEGFDEALGQMLATVCASHQAAGRPNGG